MAVTALASDVAGFVLNNWLFCLGLLLLIRAVYRRYVHSLRTVPGPFLASITSVWLVKFVLADQEHRNWVDLHRKYGSIIRISPYRVSLCSPKHTNDYFSWEKSQWWAAFQTHPHVKDHGGHFTAEESRHAKAQIMGAYNMSSIMKSESKIDTHVLNFMAQLTKRTGTAFDFAPWTQYFTLDVILDVAFSQPMGFLTQGCDVDGLIKQLHFTFDIASILGLFPSLPALLRYPLWYPRFSPKATDTTAHNGVAGVFGLAYRTAAERLNEDPTLQAQRSDILQSLISYRDKAGLPLSTARLQMEAKAPIFAGSDTTAGNIRALTLYVFTSPRVYNKLMDQITTAEAHGLLSSPVARYEEIAQHIPYLAAVRKESLRMLPVAGSVFYRAVPEGGATVEGHFLPGGTEVAIEQWPVSRDAAFFGEDAEIFRPERWTEECADEEAKRRRDLGDVFFGRGAHLCTGRNVAALEVSKVFVELLRRFHVQVVRPERPWVERGTLAVLHSDFDVVLTERLRAGG
jgi:cytochrome P450